MLQLDGYFAYAFMLGVLSTVNPCGFAMLPSYLAAFLASTAQEAGDRRAALRRALIVSGAMSSGFLGVFILVGTLSRLGVAWFEEQSAWLGLAIGVGMIGAGLMMLFGHRLSFGRLRLDLDSAGSSFRSMAIYGVSYGVSSIGCTLPLFSAVVLGSIGRQGIASGVASLAVYGLGMSLTLGTLTIALALGRPDVLRPLRALMRQLHLVAGSLMTITGAYVAWYWYSAQRGRGSAVVDQISGWQVQLSSWIQGLGIRTLVIAFGAVVACTLVTLRRRALSDRPAEPDDDRSLSVSAAMAESSTTLCRSERHRRETR